MCKVIDFQERISQRQKIGISRQGNEIHIYVNKSRIIIFLDLETSKNISIKERIMNFIANRKKKLTKISTKEFKNIFLRDVKILANVNQISCEYLWHEIEDILSNSISFRYVIEEGNLLDLNDSFTVSISPDYKIV